ncbi:Gfo/Idh/MocA family protein [Microbacterium sp. CIAB417]|uniref:Gfo/Idh/MocA family protein n=1 Tax=Microbacterium sp. CIAB417 TaxID=2860287 RepID=UPI001FAC9803|nr:Gfo/Idh/MocA family oxidoreductase [Microbacterium sp. CIAB417]
MTTQLTVAVVGLGFGSDFVPIYLSHPGVGRVVLVDSAADRRRSLAAAYGLDEGYDSLDEALLDPDVDAVHILTPVFLHTDMVVAALGAGKHVGCAVPMATSLDDLERIIAAKERSGRTYMMMETTVFAREYFAVQGMIGRGEFGALTLYRGFHIQNLDGFPSYWQGYPPMLYLTHALAPILALEQTSVASVSARGAGTLAEHRRTGGFDNPFPAEVGLFTLRDSDVLVDITMAFFQTARSYVEGFSLYGEHRGVEWPIDNEGPLTVFDMTSPDEGGRGNRVAASEVEAPEETERLPVPLRGFVRPSTVQFEGMPEPVAVGAHHGGSHPHLVHEFVTSILEQRPPTVDVYRAAAWTAPGICAHESAMNRGKPIDVPDYESRRGR